MPDLYENIESLKQAKEPWRQESRFHPGGSWLTVAAPHAGTMETHTGIIAKAIAASDYHLFVFEGLRTKREMELHVTSTNFRVPELMDLQYRSLVTLSVHGIKDQTLGSFTVVGGQNRKLREEIVSQLRSRKLKAYDPFADKDMPKILRPYSASDPENFVNKTVLLGVQLEISLSQRSAVIQNDQVNLQHNFIKSIRKALAVFEKKHLQKLKKELFAKPL